jgi:excinuclease ABC subunit C
MSDPDPPAATTGTPAAGDAGMASGGPALPEAAGAAVIEAYVPRLPATPGVYRMIGSAGELLYVGKARDLKKRVATYTRPGRLGPRLHRMVSETAAMEFATTNSEVEALLLESNLIKQLKPRYNILLRDDKSFPSILLSGDHPFPQVVKHRGAHSRKGDYFGPFASAWAVNKTVAALQRAFLLRSCADTVFAARTRPCLLYQIKRCSGPCVGRIDEAEYARLVDGAGAFLRGDSRRVQHDLVRQMEAASAELRFEDAARLRDRVRALAMVSSQQDINLEGIGDADVIAAYQAGGATCVQAFFFRGGCNYGNRAYFPDHAAGAAVEAVLEAFVGQFYAERPPPTEVLVSDPVPQQSLLAEALSVRAGRRVRVSAPQRGTKRNLVGHALDNAREALGMRQAESASRRRLLDGLAAMFDLDAAPERIEVYDNSHVSGTEAVGAMIVAGAEGLIKNAYRRFNIRGAAAAGAKTPGAAAGAISPRAAAGAKSEGGAAGAKSEGGDDYAMMREVLTRRFSRALADDPSRQEGTWPDLVLIDGGAGQLGVALQVFAELGIDDVCVAGIAKGPDRDAGRERIFLPNRPAFSPDPHDPVLYFLQRLRDEAHRFAIGGHRARRTTRLTRSRLDEIPGIGASRKRALLHHFGSVQAISRAGRADLEAVPGINRSIAKKIHDWFHPPA